MSHAYDGHVMGAFIDCACDAHVRKADRAQYRRTEVADFVDERGPQLEDALTLLLAEWGHRLSARIARSYDEELRAEKALFDRLPRALKAMVERVLKRIQIDGFAVETSDLLSSYIRRAFRDAGIRAVQQVGVNVSADITNHVDREAVRYAEERSAQLIGRGVDPRWSITDATRNGLRTAVTAAVNGGYAPLRLARLVEESFAFSRARSRMIARTELAFAHVQGNVEGWNQSGVVDRKRSILGDNHEIEDICDDAANAGAVPMNAEFVPGARFPPYHPNCVCDVLPVLKEAA